MEDIVGLVAARIKEQRKLQGLTQEALAEALGVALITIKRWEQPRAPNAPNLSMMPRLAEALGTSVAHLMGMDDAPQEEGQRPGPTSRPWASADAKDGPSPCGTMRSPTAAAPGDTSASRASGRLIYEWGNGDRIDLPDTPENRAMYHELVASAMKG